MERFEATIGCLASLVILVLSGLAYARWKHPGWLVMGLWALCSVAATTAEWLMVWNLVGTVGHISAAQNFCEHLMYYLAVPRELLSLLAVGLLVLWRPLRSGVPRPA